MRQQSTINDQPFIGQQTEIPIPNYYYYILKKIYILLYMKNIAALGWSDYIVKLFGIITLQMVFL